MGKHPQPASVLIVDDDESVLLALETILTDYGAYTVDTVASGQEAIAQLAQKGYDVALIDLTLPDLDGLAILRETRARHIATEIILVTGHGSIDTAVEAMRLGAYDYLTKPVDAKDLVRVVEHALEKRQLVETNRALQEQLDSLSRYQDLIGKSPVMQRLYRTLEAVAGSEASVLIHGESGTGKELVARAIHTRSRREKQPFLALNCAVLPANILESELFGHEKGAFTGAIRERTGYFEQADGGTLFLDELAEMPYELQAKLLRVLETQSFRRVGGQKDIQVDVRVLAATNRDPQQAVADKLLRDDLYYRLAVVEIELPPLRERSEDIPLLANAFLARSAAAADKKNRTFAPETLGIMMSYAWPGNVRELSNAIERAVILSQEEQIRPTDLPPRLHTLTSNPTSAISDRNAITVPLGTTVDEMERLLILRTLAEHNNNKTRTAEILAISLKTLHNKLGRYAKKN